MAEFDLVTPDFCMTQKSAFGDTDTFTSKGGFSGGNSAFHKGMVLVMSTWGDHAVNILWLDSNYPTTADASKPGVARGTCATTSGVPKDVESQSSNVTEVFEHQV